MVKQCKETWCCSALYQSSVINPVFFGSVQIWGLTLIVDSELVAPFESTKKKKPQLKRMTQQMVIECSCVK